MQLFNVALGGTLNQHLVGDDGVPSHRRIVGTFEGTEHEIDLDAGLARRTRRWAARSTRRAATTTRPSTGSATA